ncbi:MAG: hypothetical protein WCU88_10380 [Elusimicrobiota bacterium]|jgi:hypothetical protein
MSPLTTTPEDIAAKMLGERADAPALAFSSRRICETAFKDFHQYVLFSKPLTGAEFASGEIPAGELHWWSPFIGEFRKAIAQFLRGVPDQIRDPYGTSTLIRSHTSRWTNEKLTEDFHAMFIETAAPRLYVIYRSKAFQERDWTIQKFIALFHERLEQLRLEYENGGRTDGYSELLRFLDYPALSGWDQIGRWIADEIIKLLSDWDPTNSLPRRYPFDAYIAGTVNYGLRLVFRQTWSPLGIQPGEIVRTIPLGPKQIIKVSTRFTRRDKTARSTETLRSTETSREESDASKDASEVIQEASEKSKWDVEGSASAGWGWGSASMKASAGGESASSSKETKSHLNETMEKTASKMRSESKVVVSTEGETNFEETSSSELVNPNEEISITYVYTRLQRQYEIQTRLAEVATVVFVAEELPRPEEIDEDWIQRYGWILAQNLLDASFADDLGEVRNRIPPQTDAERDVDEKIAGLMDQFKSGLPNYSSLVGTLPDIFKTPQDAYEREIERKRTRTDQERLYKLRLNRFRQHIIDNVLHYCRAIWSAEDPEQRMLRFSNIQAPIEWKFVATGPRDAVGNVPGKYIAEKLRPLAEVVNPAGPIGFAGNYAIYNLRPSQLTDEGLLPLRQLRATYAKTAVVAVRTSGAGDAIITQALADVPLRPQTAYTVRYQTGLLVVTRPPDAGEPSGADGTVEVLKSPYAAGEPLRFEGVKLVLDVMDGSTGMREGDTWSITLQPTPILEDPDYRAYCWRETLPPRSQEEAVFSDELLADMADYVPALATAFEADPGADTWENLGDGTKQLVRDRYLDYLFLRENTRRFLLETNNLLLDLDAGASPALEDFKRLHRYVDVLKALEEKERLRLENVRRQDLITARKLGDPDIERVTVVESDGQSDLVVGDGAEG